MKLVNLIKEEQYYNGCFFAWFTYQDVNLSFPARGDGEKFKNSDIHPSCIRFLIARNQYLQTLYPSDII